MDSFRRLHPGVNIVYYAVIIVSTVVFSNPVFVLLSFLGSLTYSLKLKDGESLKGLMIMPMILALATLITNAFFVHRGMKIIAYIFNKPVTGEALAFGAIAGVMISAVLLWFFTYNKVITQDKTIFLFGHIAPVVSVVFSAVLGFIPRLTDRAESIKNGQKGMGFDSASGNFKFKAKQAARQLSILTTWSLESSMQTADSMKCRGYGIRRRTTYYPFRFKKNDGGVLAFLVLLSIISTVGALSDEMKFKCYPTFMYGQPHILGISGVTAYLLLVFLPLELEFLDMIRWQRMDVEEGEVHVSD